MGRSRSTSTSASPSTTWSAWASGWFPTSVPVESADGTPPRPLRLRSPHPPQPHGGAPLRDYPRPEGALGRPFGARAHAGHRGTAGLGRYRIRDGGGPRTALALA